MAPKPATVKDEALKRILSKKPAPAVKQAPLPMNRGQTDTGAPMSIMASASNPPTSTKPARVRPTRAKKGY
jgi:hypothetical protein